jgi:hypothetical protein
MTDELRLQELLILAQALRAKGEAVSVEALCASCPELAEPLRERLHAEGATESLGRQASEPATSPSTASAPTGPVPGTAPVESTRVSPIGRTWRWVKRHPVRAVAVVALLALVVTGAVMREAHLNDRIREEAVARKQRERMAAYIYDFNRAYLRFQKGDLIACRLFLSSLPVDLRGWEWDLLERACQR